MQIGTRVKITAPKYRPLPLTGLDAAFEGSIGTIVDVERGTPKMHRVRLDTPVQIDGIGSVRDDLWAREWLRKTSR
jgi:hypothetical protein